MNKPIYTLALTIVIAGAVFTSCNTLAQKEEAAKKEVKDAKQDLKDVRKDANAEAQKTANAQEWKAFRAEAELKISKNDVRIAELRVKLKKPGKILAPLYAQRIQLLEDQNTELRTRMDKYEKNQTDWEKFKSEFNHDMDGLGHALEDFTVDNKK